MRFSTRPALAALVLMAGMACLCAGGTSADSTNLVIGLLVPPEEPEAASLRDGVTLGVEQANQSPGPRVSLVIRRNAPANGAQTASKPPGWSLTTARWA